MELVMMPTLTIRSELWKNKDAHWQCREDVGEAEQQKTGMMKLTMIKGGKEKFCKNGYCDFK